MIDLGVALDFGDWEIPVKYAATGDQQYDDDGDPIFVEPLAGTIRGKIQPMNGRDLRDMPEGMREEAKMVIGTRSNVRVNDEVFNSKDGLYYKAIFIIPPTVGGNRTRAILGHIKNG